QHRPGIFLSGADLGIVQDWVAAAPGRFIASPFIEKSGELIPQMLRQEYAARRLAGMVRSDRSAWAWRQTILRWHRTLHWRRSSISLSSFTPKGSLEARGPVKCKPKFTRL